ncbi:MAG: exopolysaccharide biosynthesis protein [Pseudomonadota bacterium]
MPHYDYQSDARSFSQVLGDIGAKDDPKLYLGELVDAFGERGFGALMLFLGLISALIGIIPGTTTVLGTPILLIALQLVIRRDQLWLPRGALKSSIDRAGYRSAIEKAMKPLRRVERLSRPRLFMMTGQVAEVLIGLVCAILAFILILPIWGGNLVPSLIIAGFGFGLMQRDGVVILISGVATAACALFVWLAWSLVAPFLMAGWTWATHLFG